MALRLVFVSLVVLMGLSQTAWATQDARSNALARIKLALGQATLIQTMTKSVCFQMGDFDIRGTDDPALVDVDTYDTRLDAFRHGHDWMRVLPETDPAVLDHIATLETVWHAYRPAIWQLEAKDFSTAVIRQILDTNARVADASSVLAAAFLAHYGADMVTAQTGKVLKAAAHQMMLTQRAVKEMCYVYFGIGGANMPYLLQFTLEEIAAGFEALQGGDDSLAPTNARVQRNLRTAQMFWDRVTPVATQLAEGESVDKDALRKALKMNASVLKQMRQAIESYVIQ